jgi:broad specificity phosphatase PhoE
VRTVFVSPLRRALQTAYLVFRRHPNFGNIRFIVHPLLRENMHTVCDIPEDFDVAIRDYREWIPKLDLSLMLSDSLPTSTVETYWYLRHL